MPTARSANRRGMNSAAAKALREAIARLCLDALNLRGTRRARVASRSLRLIRLLQWSEGLGREWSLGQISREI